MVLVSMNYRATRVPMGLSTTGTLVKPSSSLVYTLNLYYVLKYNDIISLNTLVRLQHSAFAVIICEGWARCRYVNQ
ncbi:hypothetical protein AG1IA_10440 [Rhizoctonia solani AG-1 IA]|uniref:Uncharacterized protein n=1 Tax=Thanatephorus cucumeris (strain AG1-IA) TaxID=983506 RepID=L8WC39_THACA|nr:hypothetical protein AG1IA_10440 [Rhizoctonia solani AG-1 IA]